MSVTSLAGSVGLVIGVANKRSIAWAVARGADAQQARLVVTHQNDRLAENVQELSAQLTDPLLLPCDVTNDEQVDALFARIAEQYGRLDFLLHVSPLPIARTSSARSSRPRGQAS